MAVDNPYSNPLNPSVPDFNKIVTQMRAMQTPYGSVAGGGSSSFFAGGVEHEEFQNKGINFILGTDNDIRLAEAQSIGEKFNRTLNPLKMIASVALGIAENTGYLGDLIFDWDERDYTNGLVEWAIKARQGLDETNNSVLGNIIGKGQAYRTNPNETWALNDATWWFQNGQSLVESVGEFAVTGGVVGKGLSTLAKSLAAISKMGAVATIGSQAAANIATAGVLAYTEGAMSGARIFKEIYDQSIQEGLSENDAKQKASEAAQHTVFVNTAINTALNITSVNKLFKTQRYAKEVEEFGIRKAANESTKEYVSRLKELAKNPALPSEIRRKVGVLTSEAIQEGTEEVVNMIAEKEGYEKAGQGYSLIDTIFSSEAGLNFVLGAIGGLGQTAAMDKIPFNKAYKLDGEGKPIPKKDASGQIIKGEYETEWKSLSKLKEESRFKKYTDYVNTFSQDFERTIDISNELENLTTKRAKNEIGESEFKAEKERLQEELFNTSLLRSLYNGTAGDFESRFEEISRLDNTEDLGEKYLKEKEAEISNFNSIIRDEQASPEDKANATKSLEEINRQANEYKGFTEAMKMGLADSKEDNAYVKKATESKEKIARATREYNEIVDRFNYGDEETFNLAHYVFSNKVHLDDLKTTLESINRDLENIEAVTPSNSISFMDSNVFNDLLLKREAAQNAYEKTVQILNTINSQVKEGNLATLKAIKRKYKVKSVDEAVDIVINTNKNAANQLEELNDFFNSEIKALKDREENADKTDEDIVNSLYEEVQKNTRFNAAREAKIAALSAQSAYQAEIKTYEDRQVEMMTAKGRAKFVKISKENYEQEVAKATKRKEETTAASSASKAKAKASAVMSGIVEPVETNIDLEPINDDDVPTFGENGIIEQSKKKELSAEEALKEFTKTVNGEANFELPSFDNELLQKRIDLVVTIIKDLEEKGKVANTNDFAQICYWAYKAIGESNFHDIYNIFKGVYTIVKDENIKSGDVKNLNKEWGEMFEHFGDDHQDEGFHGVTPEDEDEQEEVERQTLGEDFKIVEASTAVAYKTRAFKENKKGEKILVSNDLYEHTNPLVLKGQVKVGDVVKFRVVTDDMVNNKEVDEITASKFAETKANNRGLLHHPIQIIHEKTGVVIGYVHSIDYITERRVATKEENLTKQTEKLSQLRKGIFDGTIKNANVGSISNGFLSRNFERRNGRVIDRPSSVAIKGEVDFVVFTGDGTFKSSGEAVFNTPLINKVNKTTGKSFYKKGAVYAVLPLPNGNHYAHLLKTNAVDETMVNTIVEAIKAAFTPTNESSKKIAEDIGRETGDNIFTPKGLENFVNRFVFSGHYEHKAKKASGRRYLNVTTNNVFYSEAKGLNRAINKETATDEKWESLRNHLRQMFFNVNTQFMNQKDFKLIEIQDGKVNTKVLKYSDLLKQVTSTDINSLKVGEDEWAYFENPVIQFNPIKNETRKEKTEQTKREEVLDKTPAEEETAALSHVDAVKRVLNKNRKDTLLPQNDDNTNVFPLPSLVPVNKKIRTTKNRIRQQLIDSGITNKYNQILDYQKFHVYMKDVNSKAMRDFGFNSDLIMVKKEINRTPVMIFRHDYLKVIDKSRGVVFDLPSFRSVDELNNSIEELAKSYEEFVVDPNQFTTQAEEDVIMFLASEINAEIKRSKEKRGELYPIVAKVRRSLDLGDVTPEDKAIWDKFFKLAEIRIRQVYKIKVEDMDNLDAELFSDYFEGGSREDTSTFEDNRWYKIDSKKTLSTDLKTFFMFIKEGRLNSIGAESYVAFDTLYNSVKALMSGQPSNYEAMLEHLKANIDLHSYMPNLIEALENAEEHVKRAFVVDMTSHYTEFKMVRWENRLHPDGIVDDKGQFVYVTNARIIDINRTSIDKVIKSQWAENLRNSELVELKNGSFVIDIQKLKAVGNKLKSVEPSELDKIQEILSELGINISIKALESLREKSENQVFKNIKSWEGQFQQNGAFGRILQSIEKTTEIDLEEENLEGNSSLYDNTGIKILAKEEALYSDNILSNSFKNGEGENVYSYSVNKEIVDRINSLKELNSELVSDLKKIPFNSTSKYLEWLSSNPTFQQRFNMFYLDTLAKKGRDGIKGKNQSKRENELLRLSLFFNQGQTAKSGVTHRLINMLIPTTSDKSVPIGISTIGLDTTLKPNGDLSDLVLDNIYNIVLGEMKRIKHHQRLIDEGRLEECNNEEFQQGGGLFYTFPELNDKEKHPNIWEGSRLRMDDIDSTDVKEYLKRFINSYILNRADLKVKEWKDMSLVYEKEGKEYLSFFDEGYIDKVIKPQLTEENKTSLKGASKIIAMDYIANTLFTNGNIFQTIIGDPAMAFKKAGEEANDDIEATLINLGKRLASLVAPGHSLVGDEKFIQVYGRDLIGVANAMDDYIKLFPVSNPSNKSKLNKYEKITKTDGQEVITWRTKLNWERDLANISDSEYKSLERIFSENIPLKDVNKELRELIFSFGNPDKPVYTGSNRRVDLGFEEKIYNKTSAFALIPQLTTGQEIDKLRIALERLERNKGKDVRFVYSSGAKQGAPNKANRLNVWTEDERISLPTEKEWDKIVKKGGEQKMLDTLFGKSSKVLDKKGLRRQQIVPFDAKKKFIIDGSQQKKMSFLDILKVDGFEYKNFKGETSLTGRALYKIYLKEYERIFKLHRESLIKELEYDELSGELNIKKLSDLLLQEADLREWSINDKKALGLEFINGEPSSFKSPLWAVANSSKFESLLKSLVDNRILNNKMSGRSFVLASPAGFKPIKEYKELTLEERGGIVYSKDFDFEKGLATEEILIPFRFRTVDGKLLNIQDYITNDGYIDMDKISPEIMEIFGFRIPTEGKNSMTKLKIVGFLPESMGDMIIASEDLIAQTGQDFDIDKLYSFLYNISISELGRIYKYQYSEKEAKELYEKATSNGSNLREALGEFFGSEFDADFAEYNRKLQILSHQNNLLDIHKSIMSNPAKEVQSGIKSPSSYGKLDSLRDKFNKIRNTKEGRISFLDGDYQRDKYISAMEGKDGISIFALNMTLNASLQLIEEDVYLNYQTVNKNTGEMEENKFMVNLGSAPASGVLNRTKIQRGGNRNKSEIMAAYTSAHTDAEKEQIHSALNINKVTYDAIRILNQLGFDEDTVIYFINQPIILEYVASVRQDTDSLHKVSGTVKKQVYDSLFSVYSKRYGIEETEDDLLTERLTDEQMVENVELGTSASDYGRTQLIALVKFVEYSKMGDALGQVQLKINTEAKGVGRDLIEADNKLSGVIDLPVYESSNRTSFIGFKNITKLLGEFSNTKKEGFEHIGYDVYNNSVYLKPESLQGLAVVNGLKLVHDLFSRYYPYGSFGLRFIHEEFKTILGKDYLSVDQQRWIWSEVKRWINSKIEIGLFKSMDIEAERQRILFDIIEVNEINNGAFIDEEVKVIQESIATRVSKAKKKYPENRFLQVLGTKKGFNGKPSKILFNAGAAENEFEIRFYQDFVSLFQDEETIELGKDLVSYAYLTGGVQQAVEFLRYLPYEILEMSGYNKVLKELDFNSPESMNLNVNKSHSWEVSPITEQIIRHNPSRVMVVKDDLSQFEVSDKKKFSVLRIKPAYREDFILDKNATVPNTINRKETLLVPYISLFDKSKNKSYRLFKYVKTTDDEYYEEIDTLGTFGISEYNAQLDNANTLIASNKVKNKEKIEVKVKKEKPRVSFKKVLNLKEEVEGKDVVNFLRDFPESSPNKKLADFLANSIELKNPKLKLRVENTTGASGTYNPATNTVMLNSTMQKKLLEEAALHEFIHSVTVNEVKNSIENPNYNPETKIAVNRLKRLKEDVVNSLTEEQTDILHRVENIYFRYKMYYKEGFPKVFTEEDKIRYNEDLDFFMENREFYYPLIDISGATIEEFITGVMTSPRLQTYMNDIKYSESRTLLDRFMQLISDILSTFKIGGEIDIKKDSILYEAMKESLYLIGINSDTNMFVNIKEEMVTDDEFGVIYTEQELSPSPPEGYLDEINDGTISIEDVPTFEYPSFSSEMEKIEEKLLNKNRIEVVCKF